MPRVSIIISLLFTSAQGLASDRLTPAQTKKLDGWEVIHLKQARTPEGFLAQMAVVVPDTPEATTYALMQIDKYKHFMPHFKDSRLVKTRGSTVYAVIETKLPWPVRDAWVYLKASHKHLGGRRYAAGWKMLNGTMKYYSGAASLSPWRNGPHHTLVVLTTVAALNTAAPDSLVSRGVASVTSMFLHRLRMRVVALRQFKKLPGDLQKRLRETP
ncbi:MAG: hypothetical protein H6707_08410 [Deltaproteobacteria bacterium]|nr:hypothetical protein [Deltaproteobacteria bacterium]